MEPLFEPIVHVVSLIEGLGVLVVVVGILAGVKVLQSPPHGTTRFSRIKSTLGRSILLRRTSSTPSLSPRRSEVSPFSPASSSSGPF